MEIYLAPDGFRLLPYELSFACEYCGTPGHHRCIHSLLELLNEKFDLQTIESLEQYDET
jgi:hypothetical protein